MQPTRDENLIGQWHGPTGTFDFRSDSSAVVSGEVAAWFCENGCVTLIGASGVFQLPYQVSHDTLNLVINGQTIAFHRAAANRDARQDAPGLDGSLAGCWRYLGGVNTYAGSTSSSACLTLNPDGTYECASEYSASGQAYGQYSLGSENADRGRWSATNTTLTLQSVSGGSRTFALQKVNHPQNGDPMIVLDGQAYVTQWQKPGWR